MFYAVEIISNNPSINGSVDIITATDYVEAQECAQEMVGGRRAIWQGCSLDYIIRNPTPHELEDYLEFCRDMSDDLFENWKDEYSSQMYKIGIDIPLPGIYYNGEEEIAMRDMIIKMISAMDVLGYWYDELGSGDHGRPVFYVYDIGTRCEFENWDDLEEWLQGVVIDDPELSDQVETILKS